MRVLTLRGWIYVVLIGALSAAITFLALVQVRHWLLDEQQLHELVTLIQQGRITITPPAQAPPVQPAQAPPAAPKQE